MPGHCSPENLMPPRHQPIGADDAYHAGTPGLVKMPLWTLLLSLLTAYFADITITLFYMARYESITRSTAIKSAAAAARF